MARRRPLGSNRVLDDKNRAKNTQKPRIWAFLTHIAFKTHIDVQKMRVFLHTYLAPPRFTCVLGYFCIPMFKIIANSRVKRYAPTSIYRILRYVCIPFAFRFSK